MVLIYSGGGDWIKRLNDETVWDPFNSGWEGDADKMNERQETHSHPGAGAVDSAGGVGHAGSLSQHAADVPFWRSAAAAE